MFVNIAEPRGLCQACLGHSVTEIDTEKEVDTKNHTEENDEKRESFEDLPEHLKLGTDFTMRVTVLQAYGLASEYTDVFTQFKYGEFFYEYLIFMLMNLFKVLSIVTTRPSPLNR